ncbi:MAG TPA: hypothetical protein VK612_03745 [Pyrinomonadaceae bacterium]|nr:hypothetical protein [Pyrinomonadaceae bacterium]
MFSGVLFGGLCVEMTLNAEIAETDAEIAKLLYSIAFTLVRR